MHISKNGCVFFFFFCPSAAHVLSLYKVLTVTEAPDNLVMRIKHGARIQLDPLVGIVLSLCQALIASGHFSPGNVRLEPEWYQGWKAARHIHRLYLAMLAQMISFRYEARLLNSIISTAACSSCNLMCNNVAGWGFDRSRLLGHETRNTDGCTDLCASV